MLTNEELHTLLDERRKELGLSHMQLGKLAFGREDASALHNMKRGSSPTYERLAAIAEALGFELYVGKPRADLSSQDVQRTFRRMDLSHKWHQIPWHRLMRRAGVSPFSVDTAWFEERQIDIERAFAVEVDGSIGVVLEWRGDEPVRPEVWAIYRAGQVEFRRAQLGPDAILLFSGGDGPVDVLTEKRMHEIAPIGRVAWMQSPFV